MLRQQSQKYAICWQCCNLSGGVALIVWFTTNGMGVKNNTIIYVARASNSKRDCDVVALPILTCERLNVTTSVRNEILRAWSLLLLAATVRSFAHMPLEISDRNRQQCFCSFILLSTQHKTTWLTAISSHCLAALPSKNVCVQQTHAAKRLLCNLKSILEDLLSCYFSAIKTNKRTIRPKFHNLPLQTIERIWWTAKTSSLHETRTVKSAVVQHECHTSVETACGEPV